MAMDKKIKKLIWSLTLSGLFSSTALLAMTVKPMHIEMESAGKQASSSIYVINEGASPLPVEMVMEKFIMDELSNTSTEISETDWLVFPPQTIIPPGGTQSFRLQWLGDPALGISQSYFAVVKQVPVEKDIADSGVQVVYHFKSVVNVAPTGTKPVVSVDSLLIVPDKSGVQRFQLKVQNLSDTHALLGDYDVILTAKDTLSGREIWDKKLSGEVLNGTVGIGLIQPGLSREFVLPETVPAMVISSNVNLKAKLVARDE